MKTVAEEQLPILGDQIEVGGDPPYRTAAAQQPRQPGARGAGSLPQQPPRTQSFRGIGDPVLIHSPRP